MSHPLPPLHLGESEHCYICDDRLLTWNVLAGRPICLWCMKNYVEKGEVRKNLSKVRTRRNKKMIQKYQQSILCTKYQLFMDIAAGPKFPRPKFPRPNGLR